MRLKLLKALIMAVGLAGGVSRGEQQPTLNLSNLVAGLQQLQDKAATGDAAASQAQKNVLRSIASTIESLGPELWNEKREKVAAAIYLLSGGSPAPLARTITEEILNSEDGALLRAGLAYAYGRQREAKPLFDRLDPNMMDKRVAGHFAYAYGELLSQDNEVEALKVFDLARLLAPGGLVEEASLRHEIRILGVIHDFDRFSFLSDQYIRRFKHSTYYENFVQSFLSGLEQMVPNDDSPETIERLLTLANKLPAEDRRRALLGMARVATVNVHPRAAKAFAGSVLQDASAPIAEQARARLYDAAARIVTGDSGQAASELQSLPSERLDRNQSALLDAARKVAKDVTREPSIPESAEDTLKENATINLAEEVLQRTAPLVSFPGQAPQ